MSDESTPSLSEVKCASLRDRGYGAGDYPPLSPLPRNLKNGKPIPPDLGSYGMLGTLEIQRILPKSGRGPAKALVRGWPTPIPMNARAELPPLPRKPVYGPDARTEVRRILREAKREGINLGPYSKISLLKVSRGERPLSYSVWHQTQVYMRRIHHERELERDMRERPLQFQVFPGQGPVVGWRHGSPPPGMKPQAPKGTHDPSAERVRRSRKEVRAHAPGRVSVPSHADAGSGAFVSRWTSVATPWSRPWPRQEAGERTNR